MQGHLRQRGKAGTYYAVFDDGRDETGKRRQRWVNLQTTSKREADKTLAKLLTQKAEGTLPPPGRITVAEVLTSYIDSRVTAGRAPRTVGPYRDLATQRIIPAIGSRKAADLRPADLERFYAEQLSAPRLDKQQKDHLSPATVAKMHAIIRAAFRHAVKQGTLTRNPAEVVTPPSAEHPEQQILTPEQVRTLLDVAHDHRLYRLLCLALSTGMREGELMGLRWGDVDLERALLTVRVQRQYIPTEGIRERRTKGYRTDRPIELTEAEVGMLRTQRARVAEERLLAADQWQDHGLVFPSSVGTPLNARNVLRWFKRTLDAAGLPAIRFHDLRHTAATLLLQADGRIIVTQQRLGHQDSATTTRFYGHALPGDQRAAATRAQAAIFGAPDSASDAPVPQTSRVIR